MATVNRTRQIQEFLVHLDRQTYRQFELIVVDQNRDNRLEDILEPYRNRFTIRYLRISVRGASHARNIGIPYGKGDIFTFPDDDCWYPPTLLEEVCLFFSKHPETDILSARSADHCMEHSHLSWSRSEGYINKYSLWNRVIEFTMFLRSEVVHHVGGFDESMGVGAGTRWGSGEGPDYLLRALEADFSIYYNPQYVIYHPRPVGCYDASSITRAYSYGGGIGALLKKHRYPLWFVLFQWFRSAGGVLTSLLSAKWNKAKYYLAALRGKVTGWFTR